MSRANLPRILGIVGILFAMFPAFVTQAQEWPEATPVMEGASSPQMQILNDGPSLLVNGGAGPVTVPIEEAVSLEFPDGAQVAVFYDSACDPVLIYEPWGTFTTYTMYGTDTITMNLQARSADDTSLLSPCISVTWQGVDPAPPTTPPDVWLYTSLNSVMNQDFVVDDPWHTAHWDATPGAEWKSWWSGLGGTGCVGDEGLLYDWSSAAIHTTRPGNGTTQSVWVLARWTDHPELISDCYSISWIGEEDPPPPGETPTPPADAPALYINGSLASNRTVPAGSTLTVNIAETIGTEFGVWFGDDGAVGCGAEAGWLGVDYSQFPDLAEQTIYVQARWIGFPSPATPCYVVTVTDTNTNTPPPWVSPAFAPGLEVAGATSGVVDWPAGEQFSIVTDPAWPEDLTQSEVVIGRFRDATCQTPVVDPNGPESVWNLYTRFWAPNVGETEYYTAAWMGDFENNIVGNRSACIGVRAVGEPQPVAPPVLTLEGVVGDITVPSGQVMYFQYPDGSEMAIWTIWGEGATCSTPPAGTAWRSDYQGNARYVTGYHLCLQARWIANPDSMSPVLSARWVAGDSIATVVRLVAPDGSTLDGAAYALFAPTASQVPTGAYLTGEVGAGNTIAFFDLPAGIYRLEVYPEGGETLSFTLQVGEGEEVLELEIDSVASPTDPTPGWPGSEPRSPGSDGQNVSSSAGEISGLPSSGSGISGLPAGLVLASIVLTTTVTFLGLAVGFWKRFER